MTRPQTVACLAGDGVGPELMAQATRALNSQKPPWKTCSTCMLTGSRGLVPM